VTIPTNKEGVIGMSDAFWAGLFVALPALLASVMAYRKSELAAVRAETAAQLATVCRYRQGVVDGVESVVKNGGSAKQLSMQDVTDEVERILTLPIKHMPTDEGHIDA
jgi:hypothetical protein